MKLVYRFMVGFWWLTVATPAFLAGALGLVIVYPLLEVPSETLTRTLAGTLAGALSFAAISFSASRSYELTKASKLELTLAGHWFVYAATFLAAMLAMSVVRERLVVWCGPSAKADLALRGLMVIFLIPTFTIALMAIWRFLAQTNPSVVVRSSERGSERS